MKRTLLALSISFFLSFSHFSLAAIEPGSVPPLALAKNYQSSADIGSYWVSEKMDGARAYWDGKQLLSRGGNAYQAPLWFTQGLPEQPLDGELWLGRNSFQSLMRIVRDQVPDESAWRRVRYGVFDLPSGEGGFSQRQQSLQTLMSSVQNSQVFVVEQQRVQSNTQLQQMLAEMVGAGAEGLMLQNEHMSYRVGRHSGVLKLKPYVDDEAVVIGFLPGKGKYHGMLGALLVEDALGRRFRLGSGLSDAERRLPPVAGTRVSYRYQGRTDKGLPRFARFLRVRPQD